MILFTAEKAINAFYRIPSLIKLNNGDLLAFADCRRFSHLDSPNRIDQCYKRSCDNGKTWGNVQVFLRESGNSPETGSSAIDGVPLYDSENDVLYFLYDMLPAGGGIASGGIVETNKGVCHDGLLCVDETTQYVWKNKRLYTLDDVPTEYETDENGNVFKGEETFGNVKTNLEGIRLIKTGFLMLMKSFDGGYTWTKPICLNESVKTENMGLLNPGPGIGIRLKYGRNKGRLVFPVYYTIHGREKPAVIYSDDGKTWKMSASINGDKQEIKTNEEEFNIGEAQIFERLDGSLVMYARNTHEKRRVFEAISYDGGETWQDDRFREDLPQCQCQASVIQFKDEKGVDYNIFLNPAHETERTNGTLRLSLDQGKTYPYSYVFPEQRFMYSSVEYLGNGIVGVLYESLWSHDTFTFRTISIEEIKKKESKR